MRKNSRFQVSGALLSAQAHADHFQFQGRVLANSIMDMGMTLAAMAGRWTALRALREASPPTQLQSLRYGPT